ncbi:MAG: c-type cytochrome [Actinobacteria bacterium]|nr:c-type cytochrome [Actinomycetota bacterium]MCL5025509.1 c-type cytochrome [Chloroflexota bacterium]
MRTLWATMAFLLIVSAACSPGPKAQASFEPVQVVAVTAVDGQFVPSKIVAMALRKVKLQVTSRDLEYDIVIPEFGVGPTRIPARGTVNVFFVPSKEGTFSFESWLQRTAKGTIVVQSRPVEADTLQNPIPSTPESVARGRQLFIQSCAPCHGTSGKGDGPAVKGLSDRPVDLTQAYMRDVTDGEMFWVIGNGWYGMPAFKNNLSEEEIWHLINYVRTIHQK